MSLKKYPYRFALLRHAQTQWNAAKRIQGQLDSPLTETGQRQARLFALHLQSLGVTSILSSDLGRTLQTSEIIRKYMDIPLFEEKRLREQDWGLWSGKTFETIYKDDGKNLTRQIAAGWDFCAPEGEDRRTVYQRVCEALKEWAHASEHRQTLVLTHEGVIRCLIYGLSQRKFLPSEPAMVKTNHLHWICYDGEQLKVEKLNAVDMGQDAPL